MCKMVRYWFLFEYYQNERLWVGGPSKTRHRGVWWARTETGRVANCSFENSHGKKSASRRSTANQKWKKKCPHKRVPFYVHKAECTASVLETQSWLDGQNQKIINQTKANLLMLLYYIIWVVSLWLCQCPIGCNFIVTGFILHTYICTTFFSGGGGGGQACFLLLQEHWERTAATCFLCR